MPYLIRNLGDADGEGHELNLGLMDDGTVILHSSNPDTGETQRIVMLEGQWASLLETLLERYGTRNCRFYRPDGRCGNRPESEAA